MVNASGAASDTSERVSSKRDVRQKKEKEAWLLVWLRVRKFSGMYTGALGVVRDTSERVSSKRDVRQRREGKKRGEVLVVVFKNVYGRPDARTPVRPDA